MSKPYCGVRKVPKGRVLGTAEQCINSGQARYYGIRSVEKQINNILAEKRKLANEKAKLKRKDARKSAADARKSAADARKSAADTKKKIKKANKDVKKANQAEKDANKTTANNKIKRRPTTTSTKKIKTIDTNQNINDILKQLSTQK